MEHDQLIGQVQARAKLSSRGEAEGAVRACLETLAERIPDGLADNLAAQLPMEIGEHLRRSSALDGQGTGERFDRDEFISRVAQRSRTDLPQATYLARVVFEVVAEASQGGIMQRVAEAVPGDIEELLVAGSKGGT